MGSLPISDIEKDRLFGAVQRCEGYSGPFIVFDSDDNKVILNLDHLTFCHFLFDPPNVLQQERERIAEVKVFTTDTSEPLLFNVDEDQFHDEDSEELGQFGHLIFMAENPTGEANEVFHFTDVDGEEASFVQKM